MGNILKNMDALQTIFYEDEKPYWRLYNGVSAKGKKIGEYTEDDGDLDNSWKKLEERLSLYDDGTFTVALLNKVGTNNQGANIHTIKLGTGETRALASTGGGNLGNQLDNLIKLNQFLGNKSDDEISGAYESAREDFKKEMELYRLKEENKNLKQGGMFERVIGMCIEKLPGILAKLDPDSQIPKGALGTIGYTDDNDPDGEEEDEAGNLDLNQLVNDATRMQSVFPDKNINQLFHRLVNYCEKNPEQAKLLLNQL